MDRHCCRRLVLRLTTTTRVSMSIVARMIPPPNPPTRSQFVIEVDSHCRHRLFCLSSLSSNFMRFFCSFKLGSELQQEFRVWLRMRLRACGEGRGRRHFLFFSCFYVPFFLPRAHFFFISQMVVLEEIHFFMTSIHTQSMT